MGEGGDGPPEICLSPSWSDFGGGKKKKEKKRLEREKKEQEKKQKSESDELRSGDSLAGKRLSKKPPAAMDTQKMPSALRLRRNSAVSSYSSSPEDAGSRSTDEGRNPRMSAGSRRKRRSKSTPGRGEPALEPRHSGASIVSAAPPQLPKLRGFGWHSRQPSSTKNDAAGGGSYEKDVVQFAFGLEASSGANHPGGFTVNYGDDHTASSPRARPLLLGPPSFNRSKTAPDLIGAEGRAAGTDTQRLPRAPGDDRDGNVPDRPGSGRGRPPLPTAAGKENEDGTRMQPTGKFMSDEFLQISRLYAGGSGSGVQPSLVKSHNDGSSYVHKQRMHQQQLSIARYQDELAVRDANEKANGDESPVVEGPSVASTRSASSESSKQRTPQTSIDSSHRTEDGGSLLLQEQPDQYPASVKEARNSTPPSPTQAPQGSRAERILSFRPFQKRGKSSKAPATTKPIPPAAAPSAQPSPALQPSPPTTSKAERPLGEPTSPLVNKNRPKSPNSPNSPKSSKSPGKDTAKEDIPKTPILQTHAQIRLPPLSLSNDDGLIPKPIQRSSTDPVLPVMSPPQTSAVADPVEVGVAHESQDQSEAGSPTGNTPRGPGGPPADNTTLPKLAPEIVVEGVNGEGLVHKTSIKRPRSNPHLLTTTAAPGTPSLDFLPQLKHQALTKPKRTSPIRPSFTSTPDKVSFPASSQFPVPSAPALRSPSDPDLKLMPRSPLRPGSSVRRRTMGPPSFGNGAVAEGLDAKPVAKLFVICCKCKFWHDLPSNLYELMAVPRTLSRQDGDDGGAEAEGSRAGKEARLDTMVQCPWCQHPMTTWCCAGWTTVVYLHERHH